MMARLRAKQPQSMNVLAWCAIGVFAVVLVVAVCSMFWTGRWTSANHSVAVQCGAVEHLWRPPAARDYIAPLCEFESLRRASRRNYCAGIRWAWRCDDYEGVWWTIVPLWIPLCAALVLSVGLWLRKRPPAEGCCQNCGYDLTGNVSGRCPECGSKKLRARKNLGR